jgi:hypothetical protein
MRAVKIVAIGWLFGTVATAAKAQDAGRVGLTTGYPATVGVLWHISENIAIRPEFSFASNRSSSESPLIDATTDFSSLGTEVSVLLFSPLRDNLKLYVAPRFAYSRTSGTSDVTESTTNNYSIGGVFGGHYSLGRRFAVFGEAGFQYSHLESSVTSSVSPALQTTSTGDAVGTRTAIGVVLYF